MVSQMSWNWIKALAELQERRTPAILVTVIDKKGSAPREAGAKMLFHADGTIEGTIGGGNLEEIAKKDATAALEGILTGAKSYPLCFRTGQCCGGAVDLLFEVINVGPQLILFGAGHVAQAIVRAVAGTPFRATVVDERDEWLEKLPADVRRVRDWRTFVDSTAWSKDQTYVAILTHNHALDEEILAAVLDKPAKYIGLIGSETKKQRFLQRLAARGLNPDQLSRFHCPIGLPIGGDAPQEIAVSFLAQLLQQHYASIEKAVHAPQT